MAGGLPTPEPPNLPSWPEPGLGKSVPARSLAPPPTPCLSKSRLQRQSEAGRALCVRWVLTRFSPFCKPSLFSTARGTRLPGCYQDERNKVRGPHCDLCAAPRSLREWNCWWGHRLLSPAFILLRGKPRLEERTVDRQGRVCLGPLPCVQPSGRPHAGPGAFGQWPTLISSPRSTFALSLPPWSCQGRVWALGRPAGTSGTSVPGTLCPWSYVRGPSGATHKGSEPRQAGGAPAAP